MLIGKTDENYFQYRIPSLVRTLDGTLLACFECRKDSSDWAKIDIKVIKSVDNGESFFEALTLHGNGNTLNNPVFIVNGDIVHLLYLENYKKLFHIVSKDNGKTFSDPVQLDIFEKSGIAYTVVAVGPGHGIVHNGNILVPVWFAYDPNDLLAHCPSFISTMYSSDNGDSWNLGEIIGQDLLVNPSECALAVNKDNVVVNSIRNENAERLRGIAFSNTGYSSWTNIRFEKNLPDPICQGSMYAVNDKIFHSNCDSKEARVNLTVKITDDDFKTYKSIFVDEVAGYSDLVVHGDTLYVIYERDSGWKGLHFKKIKIT